MMKIALFALALVSAAFAAPCAHNETTTSAHCATPTPVGSGFEEEIPCTTHGEFQCHGRDVAQCVYGTLRIFPCSEGFSCLESDFECTMDELHYIWAPTETPVSAPSPTPEPQPCENHGEYACIGSDSAVCNWGFWSITKCPEGTRCLDRDFECLGPADWERVNAEINPTETPVSAPSPTPEPTPEPIPCENHGEYACIGSDSAVCNWGFWSITKCPEGTRCLDRDFECLGPADWERVNAEINPTDC